MIETEQTEAIAERAKAVGTGAEFVAFRVGEQEFCVDIVDVREIRGWTEATALPHAPSYVRGVINLRGVVLPIIDLGARLGFGATEPTGRHVIIVVQIRAQLAGLLVDAVSDILTVAGDSVQDAPEVASDATRRFVRGVFAIDRRMIGVIGLEEVLPGPSPA